MTSNFWQLGKRAHCHFNLLASHQFWDSLLKIIHRQDIEIDIRSVPPRVQAKHFTLVHPDDDVMKKLSPGFSVKAMALLALAAFLTISAHAQTKSRQAIVMALAGDARYSAGGNGNFTPVAIGTKLHEGDVIKTGGGSHVDIDLGNNVGLLQITPNSTFVLQTMKVTETQADTVTETDLDLKEGAVFFKVNKLAKASRYEITTPKGIAGIRGTTGYMNADGTLAIGEGMGGVSYPNGGTPETFVLKDGEMVGPNDKPPHPAPGQLLRDIVEALRDAATHGIGHDIRPYVPPVDFFISPVLPGK